MRSNSISTLTAYFAKEASLVAVDCVIDFINDLHHKDSAYWKEVKKEVEKIYQKYEAQNPRRTT